MIEVKYKKQKFRLKSGFYIAIEAPFPMTDGEFCELTQAVRKHYLEPTQSNGGKGE